MADIDFGMKLEPVQRRFGNGIVIRQGRGNLARTARQHELEAHGFEQHRQAKLAQGRHRHAGGAKDRHALARIGDQLIDFILGKADAARQLQQQRGMRFLLLRTAHFLHEIFFQQLGGIGRKSGKAQCDDMRRQIMGAKNVADELVSSFGRSVTGSEALIFSGLAKFASRLVESSGNLLGGDHFDPFVSVARCNQGNVADETGRLSLFLRHRFDFF